MGRRQGRWFFLLTFNLPERICKQEIHEEAVQSYYFLGKLVPEALRHKSRVASWKSGKQTLLVSWEHVMQRCWEHRPLRNLGNEASVTALSVGFLAGFHLCWITRQTALQPEPLLLLTGCPPGPLLSQGWPGLQKALTSGEPWAQWFSVQTAHQSSLLGNFFFKYRYLGPTPHSMP